MKSKTSKRLKKSKKLFEEDKEDKEIRNTACVCIYGCVTLRTARKEAKCSFK